MNAHPAAQQVVVTGLGMISPLGNDPREFADAQRAGKSGTRTITQYRAGTDAVRIAAEVDLPPELDLDRRERLRTDRCSVLTLAAAATALGDAGIGDGTVDPSRVGVVVGSGMGGAATVQQSWEGYFRDGPSGLRPRSIPMGMVNDPASRVSIRHGFTGPCSTVSTACASGAEAIVLGHQMIIAGEADVVLAGGAEAPVVRGLVCGFDRLGALSHRNDDPASASRPFGADRDGFVMGEGAAVLVLERAGHVAGRRLPHAVLRGYGRTSDAHHNTMPHPDGVGARTAIERALRSSGASSSDVAMVNAHGTGTRLNDAVEALAVRAALGEDVPVTSTKSMIGHALGAAGALEAVATVLALADGIVPPTANLTEVDPEIGLDVVFGGPRPLGGALALSNSFAFGGHNVVLALTAA